MAKYALEEAVAPAVAKAEAAKDAVHRAAMRTAVLGAVDIAQAAKDAAHAVKIKAAVEAAVESTSEVTTAVLRAEIETAVLRAEARKDETHAAALQSAVDTAVAEAQAETRKAHAAAAKAATEAAVAAAERAKDEAHASAVLAAAGTARRNAEAAAEITSLKKQAAGNMALVVQRAVEQCTTEHQASLRAHRAEQERALATLTRKKDAERSTMLRVTAEAAAAAAEVETESAMQEAAAALADQRRRMARQAKTALQEQKDALVARSTPAIAAQAQEDRQAAQAAHARALAQQTAEHHRGMQEAVDAALGKQQGELATQAVRATASAVEDARLSAQASHRLELEQQAACHAEELRKQKQLVSAAAKAAGARQWEQEQVARALRAENTEARQQLLAAQAQARAQTGNATAGQAAAPRLKEQVDDALQKQQAELAGQAALATALVVEEVRLSAQAAYTLELERQKSDHAAAVAAKAAEVLRTAKAEAIEREQSAAQQRVSVEQAQAQASESARLLASVTLEHAAQVAALLKTAAEDAARAEEEHAQSAAAWRKELGAVEGRAALGKAVLPTPVISEAVGQDRLTLVAVPAAVADVAAIAGAALVAGKASIVTVRFSVFFTSTTGEPTGIPPVRLRVLAGDPSLGSQICLWSSNEQPRIAAAQMEGCRAGVMANFPLAGLPLDKRLDTTELTASAQPAVGSGAAVAAAAAAARMSSRSCAKLVIEVAADWQQGALAQSLVEQHRQAMKARQTHTFTVQFGLGPLGLALTNLGGADGAVVVHQSTGQIAKQGVRAGDRLTAIGGTPILPGAERAPEAVAARLRSAARPCALTFDRGDNGGTTRVLLVATTTASELTACCISGTPIPLKMLNQGASAPACTASVVVREAVALRADGTEVAVGKANRREPKREHDSSAVISDATVTRETELRGNAAEVQRAEEERKTAADAAAAALQAIAMPGRQSQLRGRASAGAVEVLPSSVATSGWQTFTASFQEGPLGLTCLLDAGGNFVVHDSTGQCARSGVRVGDRVIGVAGQLVAGWNSPALVAAVGMARRKAGTVGKLAEVQFSTPSAKQPPY
jgi:hypothetical protein